MLVFSATMAINLLAGATEWLAGLPATKHVASAILFDNSIKDCKRPAPPGVGHEDVFFAPTTSPIHFNFFKLKIPVKHR